ncbi:MAG: nucleotidyltransferase family protein [Anaerolineae bacterium]
MTNNLSVPVHITVPQALVEAFCQRNGIRKLLLFGSVLREDFTAESDVDVLVEFDHEAKPGLFDLARMGRELTGILGRRVDLLTPGFLSPYFRQQVLDGALVVYEKVA